MNERNIFEHLLSIAKQSADTDGVVTSCLVRDGEIIMDAVSAGVKHSEYELIQKLHEASIKILPDDIVFVTVQPCDSRTPGGEGEKLGDCTTNLISAEVRHVVYGALYSRSETSNSRFQEAGVSVRQTHDHEMIKACVQLFNDTNDNQEKHLPLPQ